MKKQRNKMKLLIVSFLASSLLCHAASVSDSTSNQNVFVDLAKKMVPSVVNIFITSRPSSGGLNPFMGKGRGDPNDLWRRFFEEFMGGEAGSDLPPGGPGRKVQSLGSGFLFETTEDGALILTNNHVVDQADEVKIKFTEASDEKPISAEVIGQDVDLDVAILKVKTKRKLVPVVLGDSDKLEQGEWVMAIGNPFGHGHSVVKGIVSAKERTLPGSYSNYLQVDAPINPGNSGGPLANLNAEVVGISNAVLANAQSIGFAIPINLVKKILPQLKTKGRVDRGYLGINVGDLKPEFSKKLGLSENIRAPFITNVIPGGPADKADIKPYDVILEVGGKRVKDSLELVNVITNMEVGSKTKLKILRQGKEKTVALEIAKRPRNPEEASVNPFRRKGQNSLNNPELKFGFSVENVESKKGVQVTSVQYGSVADQAGLRREDIILEVDRKTIKNSDEFRASLKGKTSLLLRIRRTDDAGQEMFTVINLSLEGNSASSNEDLEIDE